MTSSRHAPLLLLVLLGVAVLAVPARSQELLPPKVISRPFPQGVYCPLPLDLTFVANGATAVLRFSTTTVNYFDTNQNQAVWSQQLIDNVCVVSDAIYSANLGPLGSYSDQCYTPPNGALLTSVYKFQNAGTLPLEDTFTTDPATNGWDVAHGAYWDATTTAPNDPGTDVSFTPKGALGLGLLDPTFAETDSAYTTKTVTGLTSGVTYHLTGWWNVNQMQLNKISLTISVSGSNSTPIARRTWGMIKREYDK